MPTLRLAAALVLALASGFAAPACRTSPEAPPEDAVRRLNTGIALLEQHRFALADAEFREALRLAPGYLEARVNLAIALSAQVKHDEALAELQQVIAVAPDNSTAQYMSGLINKYKGERDLATTAFEKVLAVDPGDVDTRYNLATLYKDKGDLARAIALLEEVVKANPHFLSAYYALGQATLRLGQETEDPAQIEKGRGYIEKFQALSGGTAGDTAGLRYGEQGRYAMALEDPGPPPQVPALGIRFVAAPDSAIDFQHGAGTGPWAKLGSGVLINDLDGDQDEDVLLLQPAAGGAARLYRNQGQGRFRDDTEAAGLALLSGPAVAVAAGDVDGNGSTDLVLAGRLLVSEGELYRDATTDSGLGDELAAAAGLTLVDLDHDGDLDLVAAYPGGGGLRAWQNDGAGHFLDVTAQAGLSSAIRAVSLTATDFDNDRDVDLLVGTDGEGARLLSNDRDLHFTDVSAGRGLPGSGAVGGVGAVDLGGDGLPELLVTNLAPAAHVLLTSRGGGFAAAATLTATAAAAGTALFDADLDGDVDLVVAEASGLRFWRNRGAGEMADETASSGLGSVRTDVRGLAFGDLDGDGDLDLVGNTFDGPALVLLNQGAESASWVRVIPLGLNSNRSGFGLKAEVRAGRLHQKIEIKGADGYLSQSSRTATFGLDGRDRLDRLRLLWPGGVLQAETELAPRQAHVVEELDRKGSSCPFLWAWDGSQMAFVSDIQGGSPLGLWVAPGVTNLPDPDEWFLLPAGLARPRDGAYDLRITASLEEVVYLDRVMLRVIDAPAAMSPFPNERLLLAPPFAPYKLHLVEQWLRPVEARDGDGADVRDALLERDRHHAGAGRRQRFRGFAEPWSLTLDFGTLPAQLSARPLVLLAHGYTEFSNSTPIFAASQAGVHLELPALDVLDDQGRVLGTLSDAGAPAGLSKWMVVELSGALPRTGRVRVRYRTNLEVYFDQVALGVIGAAEPVITDLEAASAELRFAGYPQPWSPDGGRPVLYRYEGRRGDETWASQEGLYTRHGDVLELVGGEDDRLVVMSHGDEVALRFEVAGLPPLPAGHQRHLVLYSVGYAKDRDLRSAAPFSVGPLPFRAMTAYPVQAPGSTSGGERAAALARWSTRYVSERGTALR